MKSLTRHTTHHRVHHSHFHQLLPHQPFVQPHRPQHLQPAAARFGNLVRRLVLQPLCHHRRDDIAAQPLDHADGQQALAFDGFLGRPLQQLLPPFVRGVGRHASERMRRDTDHGQLCGFVFFHSGEDGEEPGRATYPRAAVMYV